MDAGSASLRSTATISVPTASVASDLETFRTSLPQIRLKKARLMARMEAQGPTWDRDFAEALYVKLCDEGLTPVFDKLCQEKGHPLQVWGGDANG